MMWLLRPHVEPKAVIINLKLSIVKEYCITYACHARRGLLLVIRSSSLSIDATHWISGHCLEVILRVIYRSLVLRALAVAAGTGEVMTSAGPIAASAVTTCRRLLVLFHDPLPCSPCSCSGNLPFDLGRWARIYAF
mmetsp:Transcript_22600/g.31628  ORF Transcript_22600/g.31628 Transcript_22600/m.31628 type:complete len:136 (-) Transcript_22600:294-701(-)